MQSYTLALALGLLLNGGWDDARPDTVTAAVTDDGNRPLATSHDWQAHATFQGDGRTIPLVSTMQWPTADGCRAWLLTPEVRAGLALYLAEFQDEYPGATMATECVQLGIEA